MDIEKEEGQAEEELVERQKQEDKHNQPIPAEPTKAARVSLMRENSQ